MSVVMYSIHNPVSMISMMYFTAGDPVLTFDSNVTSKSIFIKYYRVFLRCEAETNLI